MISINTAAAGLDLSALGTIHGSEATANAVTREPTADEMAETSAIKDERTKGATSLRNSASKAAIRAYKDSDSATFDAVISLALALIAEQAHVTLTEGEYEANKDAYVFTNAVLVPLVDAGHMIWRGTEAEMADIATKDGAAKKKEAVAYIRMKGGKYVQGVATLRTYGFRLASFFRDVHGQTDGFSEVVRTAAIMSSNCVPGDRDSMKQAVAATTAYFREQAIARFGNSFAKLSSGLDAHMKAKKRADAFKGGAVTAVSAEDQAKVEAQNEREADIARDQKDPIGSIMRQVVNLSDADFQSLMFRLRGEAEDRTARHVEPEADADQDGQVVSEPLRIAA